MAAPVNLVAATSAGRMDCSRERCWMSLRSCASFCSRGPGRCGAERCGEPARPGRARARSNRARKKPVQLVQQGSAPPPAQPQAGGAGPPARAWTRPPACPPAAAAVPRCTHLWSQLVNAHLHQPVRRHLAAQHAPAQRSIRLQVARQLQQLLVVARPVVPCARRLAGVVRAEQAEQAKRISEELLARCHSTLCSLAGGAT